MTLFFRIILRKRCEDIPAQKLNSKLTFSEFFLLIQFAEKLDTPTFSKMVTELSREKTERKTLKITTITLKKLFKRLGKPQTYRTSTSLSNGT
jgi:hypothetical protein